MRLLQAGVDTTVIALWLGHENVETTQIYLHVDLELKERALARTTPPAPDAGATTHQRRSSPGYKPSDHADVAQANPLTDNSFRLGIGIIRTSS